MKNEIKMVDHRTFSYRGFALKVTPELIQDVHANNVSAEEFEKYLHDIYLRNIHIVRNDKINQILEECNASKK
jgi:hypothetical protein